MDDGRLWSPLGRQPCAARWIALAALFWCAAASALSPSGTIRDLKFTQWGPRDGAPDGIQTIAQTGDGYLWVGNGAGLYRFDGLHFEHTELPHNDRVNSTNIYVLFTPSTGGLWIGFTYGGAAYLKDGHFTVYGVSDGLPNGTVLSFAEDADGTIWVATATGLARLEGSRWRALVGADGYSDNRTLQLLVDSEGTLWATSLNKVLFLPRGAKRMQEAAVQLLPAAHGAQFAPFGIAETADGSVWYAYNDRLLLLHRNKPSGRGRSSGLGALGDRDGNLWFDRHAKLQRIPHPEALAGPSWDPPDDLADSFSEKDGVVSGLGYPPIFEDREGNLWFTSFAGLCRLSESNVKAYGSLPDSNGLVVPKLPALAAGDHGALWIGSSHSQLLRLQDEKLEQINDIGFVTAATRSDDGTVWLGYTTGLWKVASGRFEYVAGPENKGASLINAIASDGAGGLWIAIQGMGAYRLKDGVWTRAGGIAAITPYFPQIMASDSKQRVWFGYGRGTLAFVDGNDVKLFFSPSARLPIGVVTAIYGKRDRVWVGGELGLAVYDGTSFREVKALDGAAFNNVTGIVETADGDVWLNTSSGIVRIPAAETLRLSKDPQYRVHCRIFDVLDGVEGGSARTLPVPSAIEGTDGRLWFSTTIGLYWIDPKSLHQNPVAPPVLIQSVSVGDTTYAPGAGLRLPQRTTSVRIDYVALSLTMAEKVRYRYKLDGVDQDWQNAQGRRQAFYTNLSPGKHSFHVIAANNDGVWNDAGATLDFDIPPTFYQTKWFIAVCIAAAALATWLAFRIRVRQVSARMRARHADRLAERERIARELHDTLLQSTQALVLQFQASAKEIPYDSAARQKMEHALDRANEVIAEGRDRVLDLRVPADTLKSLAESLRDVGDELGTGRSVAFSTVVEGQPRDLVWSVKDEVYRMAREAIINAFRHADARSIEVQIIFGATDLRVRVRDDGVGIDSNALQEGSRPGHWGLPGMRERAQAIGAQLNVWSGPGTGTEIEVTIPAVVAYRETQRNRRWFSRWWVRRAAQ